MRQIRITFERRPLGDLPQDEDEALDRLDDLADLDLFTAQDDDGNVVQAAVYQLPEDDHVHVIAWQDEPLTDNDADDLVCELEEGITGGQVSLDWRSMIGPRWRAEEARLTEEQSADEAKDSPGDSDGGNNKDE